VFVGRTSGPHDVIRGRGRGSAPRRRRRDDVTTVRQAMFAFPLHPAVLEPDLDLSLGETERVRYLDAAAPGQVAVEVELFLELERLVARVGRPSSLRVVVGARRQRRRRRLTRSATGRVRRCKQCTQHT